MSDLCTASIEWIITAWGVFVFVFVFIPSPFNMLMWMANTNGPQNPATQWMVRKITRDESWSSVWFGFNVFVFSLMFAISVVGIVMIIEIIIKVVS